MGGVGYRKVEADIYFIALNGLLVVYIMVEVYVYIFRDDFTDEWRYRLWFPSFVLDSPPNTGYPNPQEIVKQVLRMVKFLKTVNMNIVTKYKFYENYADYVIGSLNKVYG